MGDLLSPEELDTLAELFTENAAAQVDAEMAAEAKQRERVVHDVDLLKPNRFARNHVRSLERMLGAVAKGIGATLSDRLRSEISCEEAAVEQMRYSTWLRGSEMPSATFVLAITPFEAPSVMTMSPDLLSSAIDRILGGASQTEFARTEFSAAEFTVADAFLESVLSQIAGGLEVLATLSCSVQSRFSNPSMAQVLSPQDVVLGITFEFSGALNGRMRLALPHLGLAPYLQNLDKAQAAGAARPGAMREITAKTVRGVPLTMRVELGTTELPLRQLLALQVGDVLPLPTRVGMPLQAPVQDRVKFVGHIGRQGKRMAFRVAAVGDR